ncbi:MAG: VCBS repeat-containing protein [Deltaproteobacteria bacterium]|nr:VCBS repeat-containing protein [Deltaproteobacteria bacterium]
MRRAIQLSAAWVLCLVGWGCGGAGETNGKPVEPNTAAPDTADDPSSKSSEDAKAAGRVDVTPIQTAICADTRFQPTASADLDGDGELERVSARRDGEHYVVTLHALPSLEVVQSWRVRADYLELGVTRRGNGKSGDLWLHPGVVVDQETNGWRFTLEHLEGDRFVELSSTTSSSRPNLRLDVDGDGRVDPITLTDNGPMVVLGGELVPTSFESTERSIRGVPAAFGRDEPVDLDGDGDRDVVVEAVGELVIAELPSMREVWSLESAGVLAGVTRWTAAPGGYVVHALTDAIKKSTQRLLAADDSHRELAAWSHAGDGEYVRAVPFVDPAGDGSLLALSVPRFTALLAKPGSKHEILEVQLAASGDPAIPLARPVRLAGGKGPELVGTRLLSLGSPAMGGTGKTTYELRAVPPPGRGLGRLIRTASIEGEAFPSAAVLDFDGDGTSEILLFESSNYMTCDMSGGGSSSRWLLLSGDGLVIWHDEERYRSFGEGYERDETADAALIDLGDGLRGLRLRTETQEWWVFPEGRAPAQLPVCLE